MSVHEKSIIRRAVSADIPALAEYEREISVISFGGEAITDLAHHEKRLRKSMEQDSGGMFVLEKGSAVAGWLWMDMKTNFLTQENYANFRSFYIAENARGGSEAEALLDFGMEWCREKGARRVVGKVHAGNAPMRALYRKAGFEATHITMEWTHD
ncbi:MAG: GNAT family N-acetyltransferase [Clostridiales bacterium]|jgi:RimJ/RimL family protein N-acetyltransferase|nr:GNAT family N-acetyltransferase [Clostridiales bacterium]